MSVALSVRLDSGPIERAEADVAVVTFCRDDRPLRGSAGRADWRLCGRLSELIAEGRAAGEAGEALLLGPCRGLSAPLLLALGQGARRPLDRGDCLAIARDAVARALALGAARLVLPLPEADVAGLGLKRRAEAVVAGAAQALAQHPNPLQLRLLAVPEEAAGLGELLPVLRPRPLPGSVLLSLPTSPRRARGSAGMRRGPPPVK